MPATTSETGAAARYARALLELANERQQAEEISREMLGLQEVLDQHPAFEAFLRDPGISESERSEVLERVLAGRLSPLVMNTLRVMNEKGRARLVRPITEQYLEMLDEQLGKIEVDVTVAERLEPDLLDDVRRQVSRALRKEAVVHQYVDESIIGGIILRVEDRLIDGSVRTQLEAMKRKLTSARA